eukprot:CAMPEP_0179904176 /NCGR_PEP_ID=MMETSP0982-20121206/41755_2 /TAXON_ID=483367 /ORGANISM="non described non described, Strain CCMP 2436" /LENGTH=175 /DNA_ID=CAMNT_0021803967 /DNA_START=825 /DNA_END=1352 /DNA_ORIENTATION=-
MRSVSTSAPAASASPSRESPSQSSGLHVTTIRELSSCWAYRGEGLSLPGLPSADASASLVRAARLTPPSTSRANGAASLAKSARSAPTTRTRVGFVPLPRGGKKRGNTSHAGPSVVVARAGDGADTLALASRSVETSTSENPIGREQNLLARVRRTRAMRLAQRGALGSRIPQPR